MDRRTFIKSVVFGGLALPSVVRAWPPTNPALLGGAQFSSSSAKMSWSTWNELSESGVSSSDIFICMMEGSGDETGEGGGITGTDAVLGATGSPATATGTPSYRVLDGINDGFNPATALITDIFNSRSTWSLIIKLADISDNTQSIFQARSSLAPSYGWEMYGSAGGSLVVQCSPGGSGAPFTLDTSTSASIPTSGIVYIACWFDGTYWRAGFSTTKPTKWSDFGVNNRISLSDSTQWNCNFAGGKSLCYGDYGYTPAKLYYIVASKLCLIDNAL